VIKLVVLTLSIFAGTWLVWIFLIHKNDQKQYEKPVHPFADLGFQLIAHRGGGGEAPENTFLAFDHALSIDPEMMFELDVQLTQDGEVVVMHVAEMTWAQLALLDATVRFEKNSTEPAKVRESGKSLPASHRIPLLKEVLERYPNTKMIVEMKDNYIGKAEPIAEVVIQAKAGDRVIFAGESPKMLLEIRRYIQPNPFGGLPMTGPITPEQMEKAALLPKNSPPWMFAASKDEMTRTAFLDGLGLIGIDRMRAEFLSIPEEYDGRRLLTDSLLQEVHRRHKRLFVWTVNEESDMKRLIGLGVDGVITDYPSRLKKVLSELGSRGK
jgi:glycerophosphoryl diester phosphodiesterase